MDIIQLAERLGDIKISDIEGGVLVSIINQHLPDNVIINSATTGDDLKNIYQGLQPEQKKILDAAVRLEDDPKKMVGILNAIDHLETQRISLQKRVESTNHTYLLMTLLIVLLFNGWLVYSYHLQAKQQLGTYQSTLVTFVVDLIATGENLQGSPKSAE